MSPRADGGEPAPLPADAGGPDRSGLLDLDPRALAADDALLTALGAGPEREAGRSLTGALTWDDQPLTPAQPEPAPVEGGPVEGEPPADRVTALLAALRADVGRDLPIHWGAADPLRAPAARPARRGVLRLVPRTVAVASATAVVLSAGGVAAAAVGAGPQSWLYPLHRMLVTDEGPSASALAATEVRRDLAAAAAAIDAGDTARAGASLAAARRALPAVAPVDGAVELAGRLAALDARLAAISAPSAPSAPSTPAAPAVADPGTDAPRPGAGGTARPGASAPADGPAGRAGGRGQGHSRAGHRGPGSRSPGAPARHGHAGSGGAANGGAAKGGTANGGAANGSHERAKGSGDKADHGGAHPSAAPDTGGGQDGGDGGKPVRHHP